MSAQILVSQLHTKAFGQQAFQTLSVARTCTISLSLSLPVAPVHLSRCAPDEPNGKATVSFSQQSLIRSATCKWEKESFAKLCSPFSQLASWTRSVSARVQVHARVGRLQPCVCAFV